MNCLTEMDGMVDNTVHIKKTNNSSKSNRTMGWFKVLREGIFLKSSTDPISSIRSSSDGAIMVDPPNTETETDIGKTINRVVINPKRWKSETLSKNGKPASPRAPRANPTEEDNTALPRQKTVARVHMNNNTCHLDPVFISCPSLSLAPKPFEQST